MSKVCQSGYVRRQFCRRAFNRGTPIQVANIRDHDHIVLAVKSPDFNVTRVGLLGPEYA